MLSCPQQLSAQGQAARSMAARQVAAALFCLQDYVVERLQAVPGLQVRSPEGAFYMFTDVRAVVGPQVNVPGFGPVPNDDELCR